MASYYVIYMEMFVMTTNKLKMHPTKKKIINKTAKCWSLWYIYTGCIILKYLGSNGLFTNGGREGGSKVCDSMYEGVSVTCSLCDKRGLENLQICVMSLMDDP